MIHYQSVRDGDRSTMAQRNCSVEHAAVNLIVYEMGFGGQVVLVDTKTVGVRTHVLSHVDEVLFTGPEEEMRILLQLLDLYMQQSQAVGAAARWEAWEALAGEGAGKALLARHVAPVLLGGALVKQACATALFACTSEADVHHAMQACAGFKSEVLVKALCARLLGIEGTPQELLDLVAQVVPELP